MRPHFNSPLDRILNEKLKGKSILYFLSKMCYNIYRKKKKKFCFSAENQQIRIQSFLKVWRRSVFTFGRKCAIIYIVEKEKKNF